MQTGAQFKTCDFGTDCHDCGPRMAGSACVGGKVKMCGHSCSFAKDGRCDDGGPGSVYQSCTLGSDCADCGPRDQPCGEALAEPTGTYTYETLESPPPAPSQWLAECKGGGEKRCDPDNCNMFLHAETTDCSMCACAACVFCVLPEGLEFPPPPVVWHLMHPPPPPPPSPPFVCSMLDGRHNVLTKGGFCYTLSPSACENGFVYSESKGLSVCQVTGGVCEPMHIGAAELKSVGGCPEQVNEPPEPPAPPPSLYPPPDYPSPPPPPPCVPLSGKCGGSSWTGSTECCTHQGAEVHCYEKNAFHSQCRTSCNLPGWDCAAQHVSPPPPAAQQRRAAPPAQTPRKRASSPPPPPIRTATSAAATTSGRENDGEPVASSSHSVETEADKDKDEEDEGEAGDEDDKEENDHTLPHTLADSDIFLGAIVLLLVVGNIIGCAVVCFCCPTCFNRGAGGYAYSKDLRTTDDLEPATLAEGSGVAHDF